MSKSQATTKPKRSPGATSTGALPEAAFRDAKHDITLYHGDCLELLTAFPPDSVDLIFADPPYFLSNHGITCHAGRMVSVNKGDWDRSRGPDTNHEFNKAWLFLCQRVLKPNGTIWVSGTSHRSQREKGASRFWNAETQNRIGIPKGLRPLRLFPPCPAPQPVEFCAQPTRPTVGFGVENPFEWITSRPPESEPPEE